MGTASLNPGLSAGLSGQRAGDAARARIVDESTVAERICRFLERRHRQSTNRVGDLVAAETNIPADTVRKMLSRRSLPSPANLIRLGEAYGLEFLVEVYPAMASLLGDKVRDERRAKLDAAIAALESERDSL